MGMESLKEAIQSSKLLISKMEQKGINYKTTGKTELDLKST